MENTDETWDEVAGVIQVKEEARYHMVYCGKEQI